MNIKNKTIYNKNLIVKYNKFYLRNYMKKNFIIIGIISIGFIIYMLIQDRIDYALLLMGILIMYYILTLLMQKFTIKRMLKKSPLVDNPVTQTYVFMDKKFKVENTGKSYEVYYDSIKSAKTGKDFYLLQSDQRKSYIIDFNGFDNEADKDKLEEFFIVRFNMTDKFFTKKK
ncbi:MAG: YcxB family protein [Candidatus Izemoplasmatales bacterium]